MLKVANGKTKREKLEVNVDRALGDLASYFTAKDDPLQFEVNRLWRQFDHLKSIPDFPTPQQKGVG